MRFLFICQMLVVIVLLIYCMCLIIRGKVKIISKPEIIVDYKTNKWKLIESKYLIIEE